MSGAWRTQSGGRIDRARPVAFSFDGVRYAGFHGDTLASALLANGIHLVGRSFKYHRPRGIVAAGSEEPNALVTVVRDSGRTTPNLRATEVEIYDGLAAASQNRWPSLARDLGAINDLASPLIPAGFYYKTFMGPTGAWRRLYEPLIRRTAGLGRAPRVADPDRYANRFAHCDVLIVGAGPAGLAAAAAAAETGARVVVADEQAEPGGSLLSETVARIDGSPAAGWAEECGRKLAARGNVRLLARTTAFGYFGHELVGLAERVTDHVAAPEPSLPRERLWQVRARRVVLATGSIEQPLVFPDNDRPGIMLAGAGLTYLERYGVRLGDRVVLVGSDDMIYRAALALDRHGVEVAAVVDLRTEALGGLADEARAAGIDVHAGLTITGTSGRRRVATVHVGTAFADGTVRDAGRIHCDHLLMSGGMAPALHLFSQARGRLRFDEALGVFLPGEIDAPVHIAGAAAGTRSLAAAIESGYASGDAAAAALGLRSAWRAPAHVTHAAAGTGKRAAVLPHGRSGARVKAFVDFQNDVTAKDIVLARREGFRSIEHVKRYTTTGMATDQGKTSNLNALTLAADLAGKPLPEVGLTTFRMPYTPVTFGTFAGPARGALFDPVRQTPMHAAAEKLGAVFEDVGQWKRARFFPRQGERMAEAVERECRTVRAAAGIFDASTLGKIEVVGPDAGAFLDRIYTNTMSNLAVGRCRYGLMLTEAGFIMDDGIAARLAADRFHLTTTTGGAARVLHHMEDYLQTEFPDLRAWLTSTTEQWSVIAVQGPRARDILAPLVEGASLATADFPHMSVRECRVAGVEARLFRASFTGELGFEVNVPAGFGRAVWEAVWSEAQKHGACVYGTETMHVLRAEKGYIIVGQETDGTVTPGDLGLDWAIGKAKADFVGRRSLARPDMLRPDRKQLVGLIGDPAILLEDGTQVTDTPDPPTGTRALGHVTSSYHSTAAGRPIALALVAAGRARTGSRLYVPMPGGSHVVTVTEGVFYDKSGERLRG